MTFRIIFSGFFLIYGLFLPFLAKAFFLENFVTSVCIILTSFLLALLLLSGRAIFLNIILSLYILRVYFTRPFVELFSSNLESWQYIFIDDNFWNFDDAKVVYLSLLSLVLAWYVGLHFFDTQSSKNEPIWFKVFRQADDTMKISDWRMWLVLILLFYLNYQPPIEGFQGMDFGFGEGQSEFALGALRPSIIAYILLTMFIMKLKEGKKNYIYLVPVLFIGLNGIVGGSRSALFLIALFSFTAVTFLFYDKFLTARSLKNSALVIFAAPVILFSGLVANNLRPLLRSDDVTSESYMNLLRSLFDFEDPNNPIVSNLEFGLTVILHRLSSIEAQFYILNDRFINNPLETYNPLYALMRIINDLIPGSLFPNVLTINQLWDYIYLDSFLNYSSQTWSIQGTLYLYFGHWLSPVIVFFIGIYCSRNSSHLNKLLILSPAFFAFFFFFFAEFIDNGTFERAIPVNIIKPIISIIFFTYSVRALRLIFPERKIIA